MKHSIVSRFTKYTAATGKGISDWIQTAKGAAYVGLFSVFFFSIAWIIGVMIDGTWVFGENMVSELSVSEEVGAIIAFTVGSIVAGIGFIVYGFLMARISWLIDVPCG